MITPGADHLARISFPQRSESRVPETCGSLRFFYIDKKRICGYSQIEARVPKANSSQDGDAKLRILADEDCRVTTLPDQSHACAHRRRVRERLADYGLPVRLWSKGHLCFRCACACLGLALHRIMVYA